MSLLITHGQTNYDFFTTADGSPSICLSSPMYRPEAMHHRQGALAESVFVYHGVLNEALRRGSPPQILSVGLGCAYNEMIAVAHFLKTGSPFTDFYLESFEGEDILREGFRHWLTQNPAPTNTEHAPTTESQLNMTLQKTFASVNQLVGQHFGIDPQDLRQTLSELLTSGQLVLRDWLTADTPFRKKFGVIFFDAFSRQSTPEIWSDEFLVQFLTKTAADQCGIATYAATGSLNRALRAAGFERVEMPGFSGKRQSTRAFRNVSVTL